MTSDHFQTPKEAVSPLLPYLNPEWTIWEPARGKGNIVCALRQHGFDVFGTDILDGVDFLTTVPDQWDVEHSPWAIVTNPPYSIKDEFIARCYEWGKPFALLMPLTALEGLKRQALYREHGLELLIPSRRIAFETPSGRTGKESSPQFTTAWYTWGLNIGKELSFVDMPRAEKMDSGLFDAQEARGESNG